LSCSNLRGEVDVRELASLAPILLPKPVRFHNSSSAGQIPLSKSMVFILSTCNSLCYDSMLKGLSKELTLVLSDTRELDRVSSTE